MDTRKSITNGLNNAVSNLIYGTNPLGSVKEAFGRGFGVGAATSAINYISDLIGQKPVGSGVNAELLSGITGAAVSPFAAMRDPRRGCGSASPFTFSLGYSTAKGYRYDTPQTTNQPQSQRRGFSLKAFLGETLLGGLTGGFTSAAFYGAGKGIEKLAEGFRSSSSDKESNYILYNKTHKDSLPKPKGIGPNGGRLQSHHALQQEWAINNLSQYGYDPKLAPTVTIETGMGLPHTAISNLQNMRRDARVASGAGKWGSSLQDELSYIVSDFRAAGFSDSTISKVLEQQYRMLDKLGILYERIRI